MMIRVGLAVCAQDSACECFFRSLLSSDCSDLIYSEVVTIRVTKATAKSFYQRKAASEA